jgi:hypothetical protein
MSHCRGGRRESEGYESRQAGRATDLLPVMESHGLILKVNLEESRVLEGGEDVFVVSTNRHDVGEVADEGDGDVARLVKVGADGGVGYQTVRREVVFPVDIRDCQRRMADHGSTDIV